MLLPATKYADPAVQKNISTTNNEYIITACISFDAQEATNEQPRSTVIIRQMIKNAQQANTQRLAMNFDGGGAASMVTSGAAGMHARIIRANIPRTMHSSEKLPQRAGEPGFFATYIIM